ncbi:winged helix-turn-helix domain-containing protein [Serratia inhibens]|uniref:winged helix-turn-helix domain-containing protein n=1 Tax=Serratia inhibens TaxID=2338073 RepID=UPI0008094ACE|nr:winged helix-turn-helix domain-containing protein [Serratia inhibens]ANS44708.1 hypothetical protein Q5A_021435 [Serratia inhibens PRI-2C]
MEFIINEVLKYNSSDGTLICPDNSVDMITLTRVANELLLLFINNNHISLRRDDILNELWEKRGLSASSNNLNNYVSMLRRALEQCGFAGLITTIPKYGFIFEADVVAAATNALSEDTDENAALASLVFNDEEKNINPKARYFSSVKLKVAFVFIVTIMILFSSQLYEYIYLKSNRTEVFGMGKCTFYLIDDKIGGRVKEDVIHNMKAAAKKEKINCDVKSNVYYVSEGLLDLLGKKYVSRSLMYCPYGNKLPCENYHISIYDEK